MGSWTWLLIRGLSGAFCLHSRQIKSFAAHTAPSATAGPLIKTASQHTTWTEAVRKACWRSHTLVVSPFSSLRRPWKMRRGAEDDFHFVAHVHQMHQETKPEQKPISHHVQNADRHQSIFAPPPDHFIRKLVFHLLILLVFVVVLNVCTDGPYCLKYNLVTFVLLDSADVLMFTSCKTEAIFPQQNAFFCVLVLHFVGWLTLFLFFYGHVFVTVQLSHHLPFSHVTGCYILFLTSWVWRSSSQASYWYRSFVPDLHNFFFFLKSNLN